jgi:hypothetical protein
VTQRVPLTKGKVALVDDEDFAWIRNYKWYYGSGGYPCRGVDLGNNNVVIALMHRLIMRAREGVKVDHINGDTCDNRRENLRIANDSQNQANRRKGRKPTSSRFKGVHKRSVGKPWGARIQVRGEKINLGCYTTEEDAARAYNAAALEAFGDYAHLNDVPPVVDAGALRDAS